MKANPTYDKIIVEEIVVEKEDTVNGIYIPTNSTTLNDSFKKGTVVKCGPGRQNSDGNHVPMCCKEGDEIMFGAHAGQQIKLEDNDYVLLSEQEVLIVL